MIRSTHFAALVIPFALVACAGNGSSDDDISAAESAATTTAVESTVVALAPITSTDPQEIAAAYLRQYPQADGSCATIETDNRTFVRVTFACTGPLQTTGTLELAITSATTVEATAALAIGQVAIEGALVVAIPLNPTAQRTLDGSLVIAGPRRELDADARASWLVDGSCVTLSASGSVSVGAASRSFTITDKTVCQQ